MVVVVVNAIVGVLIQQEFLQEMQAQDPNLAVIGTTAMQGFAAVGVVFALLWGLALPVFMLIWFARRTIKEQVAQWEGGPGVTAAGEQ